MYLSRLPMQQHYSLQDGGDLRIKLCHFGSIRIDWYAKVLIRRLKVFLYDYQV